MLLWLNAIDAFQGTRVQSWQLCDSKALTPALMFANIGPMEVLVCRTWSLAASVVL
jgi:hypothetical protein